MLKRFKQLFQAESLEDGINLIAKKLKELQKDLTQQLQTVEERSYLLSTVTITHYFLI